VWAVRQRRPFLVSVGVYAGVLLFGPLFLSVSLVGSEGAKHLIEWLELPFSSEAYQLASAAGGVLVFSLLYKFAPHAPVPWKSAFIGGAVAGLAWEAARHVYGGIASLILNANMLYGSLGVAPLFLMWVYIGWYIILAGARLAYAVEHADFHDEFSDLARHPRSQELVGARIAELLTAAVLEGSPGLTTRALAARLSMPEQRIIELTQLLEKAELLARTQQGELAPARDPATLTLADVSMAVGGTARLVKRERVSRTGQFTPIARIFTSADEVTTEKLKGISWEDLAQGARPEGPKT
jgi:membrane protein